MLKTFEFEYCLVAVVKDEKVVAVINPMEIGIYRDAYQEAGGDEDDLSFYEMETVQAK